MIVFQINQNRDFVWIGIQKRGKAKMAESAFIIREERRVSSTLETIEFIAIDEKGADIWGTHVPVYRIKSWENLGNETQFSEWKINYSSCGAGTYKEKLPFVAAINAAMEFLKKQEEAV